MSEINEARLVDALAAIEVSQQPGYGGTVHHDQSTWGMRDECGSTLCLAGWVTLLDGWEPEWGITAHSRDVASQCSKVVAFGCWETKEIDVLARHLLGLTESQMNRLFYDAGDLDDLYRLAAPMLGMGQTVLREKVAARAAEWVWVEVPDLGTTETDDSD